MSDLWPVTNYNKLKTALRSIYDRTESGQLNYLDAPRLIAEAAKDAGYVISLSTGANLKIGAPSLKALPDADLSMLINLKGTVKASGEIEGYSASLNSKGVVGINVPIHQDSLEFGLVEFRGQYT